MPGGATRSIWLILGALVADDVDIANNLAEIERQHAVANIVKHIHTGESPECCDECENDIPEARRLALPGVRLCIECATAREIKRRAYV